MRIKQINLLECQHSCEFCKYDTNCEVFYIGNGKIEFISWEYGPHNCVTEYKDILLKKDVCSHVQEFCSKCEEEDRQYKWHKFYLNVAKQFSSMSKDPRLKVGCVIVTQNGILYPGINGLEKGGTNQVDSLEAGNSGCVHSEMNSLIRFNPSLHKNCNMYLTHCPCRVCSRAIINTEAISGVYYLEEYRDTSGVDILRKSGIIAEKIEI